MFFPIGGWASSSVAIKFKEEGDQGSSKMNHDSYNSVLYQTVILWNKTPNR